jgi:adenylyl-sulfate kinase
MAGRQHGAGAAPGVDSLSAADKPGRVAADEAGHATVDKARRAALKGQRPVCLWLTGLPGAGKTTIAVALEARLNALGRHTYLLDGDRLRTGLNRDLGFSAQDRNENIRRAAEVAHLMVDAGLIVICAFISPYREERRAARALFAPGEFVEVYLETSQAVCEARDPNVHSAGRWRGSRGLTAAMKCRRRRNCAWTPPCSRLTIASSVWWKRWSPYDLPSRASVATIGTMNDRKLPAQVVSSCNVGASFHFHAAMPLLQSDTTSPGASAAGCGASSD